MKGARAIGLFFFTQGQREGGKEGVGEIPPRTHSHKKRQKVETHHHERERLK